MIDLILIIMIIVSLAKPDVLLSKKMKKPSFLMVLTATGKYAYKREDEVYVVPIGSLKD